MVMSFYHYNDITDLRADSVRLFVFYLSLGLVRMCEIEISHMGKSNRNLDLVCEKYFSIPPSHSCLISFTGLYSPSKLLIDKCICYSIYTVKPVFSDYSKIDKTKVFKTNGSFMKVESIAECSLGAVCNTFDLH